jgi:hypothetical protein
MKSTKQSDDRPTRDQGMCAMKITDNQASALRELLLETRELRVLATIARSVFKKVREEAGVGFYGDSARSRSPVAQFDALLVQIESLLVRTEDLDIEHLAQWRDELEAFNHRSVRAGIRADRRAAAPLQLVAAKTVRRRTKRSAR